MAAPPESLKGIKPFLLVAKQYEPRDKVVAYYSWWYFNPFHLRTIRPVLLNLRLELVVYYVYLDNVSVSILPHPPPPGHNRG